VLTELLSSSSSRWLKHQHWTTINWATGANQPLHEYRCIVICAWRKIKKYRTNSGFQRCRAYVWWHEHYVKTIHESLQIVLVLMLRRKNCSFRTKVKVMVNTLVTGCRVSWESRKAMQWPAERLTDRHACCNSTGILYDILFNNKKYVCVKILRSTIVPFIQSHRNTCHFLQMATNFTDNSLLCYCLCVLWTDGYGDNAMMLETILAFATSIKEVPAAGFQQQPTFWICLYFRKQRMCLHHTTANVTQEISGKWEGCGYQ